VKGFGFSGLGCRACKGCKVQAVGYQVSGIGYGNFGLRIQGRWKVFKVWDFGLQVWGSGYRISGLGSSALAPLDRLSVRKPLLVRASCLGLRALGCGFRIRTNQT
jgi:hypothetical protein